MVRLFNYLLRQKHLGSALVQLGGLEPPTSCSTDRRSNQLSYNCIAVAQGPKTGARFGRKLGATPAFGKAGTTHPGVVPAKAGTHNHRPLWL
jgi:hypothetical protein